MRNIRYRRTQCWPRLRSCLPLGLLFLVGMISQGCSSLAAHKTAKLPDRRTVSRDSLIFHSNFYFPKRHRLVEELLAKRSQMQATLGLEPTDEPINVFLFQDEEKFRHFLKLQHPSFPDRRAFFLQSATNLVVYAHWNTRVAEDLRHEVTHAYLHSVIPEVPLWLDEGIAEYFEVPTSVNGLNQAHVDYLIAEHTAGRWTPNLERLESLEQPGEMSQTDYAESWLWIHYLIHHDSANHNLLQSYLQQWQYDRLNKDLTLYPQLRAVDAESDRSVVEHLLRLETGSVESEDAID